MNPKIILTFLITCITTTIYTDQYSQYSVASMFKSLYAICTIPNTFDTVINQFNNDVVINHFKQYTPAEKLYNLIWDCMEEHYGHEAFEVHGQLLPWQHAVVCEAAERYFALHHAANILTRNKSSILASANSASREQLIRELVWQEFSTAQNIFLTDK